MALSRATLKLARQCLLSEKKALDEPMIPSMEVRRELRLGEVKAAILEIEQTLIDM